MTQTRVLGWLRARLFSMGGCSNQRLPKQRRQPRLAWPKFRRLIREGVRVIESARQNIESMDKAIALARENASLTADEIVYLRQQLIIGGSTLDSVLSAEARLYEAESKEINFIAEKRQSQLVIVTALGLLGPALGL